MSNTDFKYTLGSKVKDKITGYEGIITACTEWLYGCRRYVIQAQGLKDGVPIAARGTDEDALELIDDLDESPIAPKPFKYELGSKVQDAITTYKGIIVGRTRVLHSENVYDVQSQELKDGAPVKPLGVSEEAVRVEVAAEPHQMSKTGGPGDPPAGYTVGRTYG